MEGKLRAGSGATIGSFIFGTILKVDAGTQDAIIFYLQVAAFLVSITVGVLTAIYYFKRIRRQR